MEGKYLPNTMLPRNKQHRTVSLLYDEKLKVLVLIRITTIGQNAPRNQSDAYRWQKWSDNYGLIRVWSDCLVDVSVRPRHQAMSLATTGVQVSYVIDNPLLMLLTDDATRVHLQTLVRGEVRCEEKTRPSAAKHEYDIVSTARKVCKNAPLS